MSRARRPDRLAHLYIFDHLFGRLRACLWELSLVLPALGLLAGFWFLVPAPLFAEDPAAGAPSGGPAAMEVRDAPEAVSGLTLGEGVVLRAGTGGVMVESDRSGRQGPPGWTGVLLLLFGFGLGLAAAVLVRLYLVHLSEKSWPAEPQMNQVRVVAHSPDRLGLWKEESDPEAAPVRAPDLAPLLTAAKNIEKRLDDLDAMFRKIGEKTAAADGFHQALARKVTQAGQKLKRLESRLDHEPRFEGDRAAAPPPEDYPAPVAESPPVTEAVLSAEMGAAGPGPAAADETEEPVVPAEPRAKAHPRPPEDMPDTPGLNLHARARYLRNLGGRLMNDGLLSGAEANLSRSLAIMEKLADQEPENQACLRDLILAYHSQGRVLERMERLGESADYYQRSVRLTASLAEQAPDCFDWRRGLAASHGHLGRIQAAAGEWRKARENLTQAVELMRTLVEKRPDNRTWRYALAGSLHNLALVQEKTALHDEALRSYREEMDIMRQLMKEEPDDHACALNLGTVCCVAGRLLKDMGQMPEALESTLQYVDLMRGLVKRKPGDDSLRRELSVAIGQLGRFWEVSGDSERALAAFEEALDIRRTLAAGAPGNDIWQCDLAVGLCKIGDTHFAERRWDEALNFYREALEVVEALEEKHGPEGAWLMEKCGILLRMGNYYRNTDKIKALEYYRRALAIAESRAKADGGPEWSELERVIRGNMGGN